MGANSEELRRAQDTQGRHVAEINMYIGMTDSNPNHTLSEVYFNFLTEKEK